MLRLDTSDIGNAQLFAAQHKNDLRWFPARKTWLVWRHNRWVDDTDGESMRRAISTVNTLMAVAYSVEPDSQEDVDVKAAAKERDRGIAWANASRNRERLRALRDIASNAPGICVSPQDLDADPWLLNCQNGVLDLRTGVLQPPTRDLLQTKLAGCDYVPGAKSELWEKFVTTLTGGDVELAGYLQRSLGYALYGAWAEKAFWFAYGPPDGGKSTLLAIVGRILGDYHVSADASTWMQGKGAGNRGDIVRLMGARFVTTSEVRAGCRFDEEVVKKITGGDLLTYAAKYEADVTFAPTFALWLAANDRPAISSGDDGMWRRVNCIPCVHAVPKAEQNPRLVTELASPEHAPAVLAWLVEGCRLWSRDGLGTCKAIDAENAEYKREMNPLADFAEDALVFTGDDADWVSIGDIRDEYTQWCERRREKFPLKAKTFNRCLKELGAHGGTTDHKVKLAGGATVTVWRRVRRTFA